MKIAIYGASGMIGQRIVAEALRRGHAVTAIARNPSKIEASEGVAGLRAVAGDVTDASSVAQLAAGHDAVISSISPTGGQPLDTFTKAAHALIQGLPQAGVARLLVVGGAGSLEVAPGKLLMDSGLIPEAWMPAVRAHADTLKILKAEGDPLDWVYFSPAALIEPGERTGHFRLGGDQLITDAEGNSKISAEDYAVAVLDELEKPQHHRERFTIGY